MQKRYLTELEQSRLMLGVSKVNDPLAQRDYHWIGALILTGMRIQEFSRLTVPMVQQALALGWLVSPKEYCKGGRRCNEYLVTARLRTHLEALVKLSNELGAGCVVPAEGQPLVWGRDVAGIAGALSVRSYEARLKQWAVHAQLDARISPHWLRHTRGMNIMRRSRGNNPLKVAQIALNHSSLKSTGIYLDMSREEFERELQLVDGGRVPKKVARKVAQGVAA
ncbi:site-specific integrase [Acidovorax sp. sif1233]|uniref:tyrosine-type recombinase/integrase n=1 Tax=Acidovorax sp. sif1233 TaxID=2854792 RepID=UPI001C479D20|nr:tyrosine-type recombinase/integrase [Acidovorax sp. sif1233]MBV7454321.1 site-specific integrase [Acidovorax sp. sif1233]